MLGKGSFPNTIRDIGWECNSKGDLMISKRKIVAIFIFYSLIVNACNGSVQTQTHSPNNDDKSPFQISTEGCILPTDTFSYSIIPQPPQSDSSGNRLVALPPAPWQSETRLADSIDTLRPSSLFATRYFDGHVEVWISGYSLTTSDNNNGIYQFFVYRTDTKAWKSVSSQIEDTKLQIGKIFVAQDNTVWGQIIYSGHEDPEVPSLLSRYNEKTERFEFEDDAQNIPVAGKRNDGFFLSSKVLLDDSKSIFWTLVPEDAIYSYNPVTQESKKHIILPNMDTTDLVVEPTFSPDGNIYYLTDEPFLHTNRNVSLYSFDPATGVIERILIGLEPWPVVSSVFADHTGRLWFGGVGWRETDGNWHQILRSPIFITNMLWSGMDYRWKPPNILMESSDNRLWFESENGMVWLDPSEGKWCWFTTIQSNIIEDKEKNLWMIADAKLYKYPLNP